MTSTVPTIPADQLPRHVAIIMDGNGRWAKQRFQPRAFGHRAGVRSARKVVRAASKAGIEVLTMFAFSQENWHRPLEEVTLLMSLFVSTLKREIAKLDEYGLVWKFIGDHSAFAPELRQLMGETEARTRNNKGMTLLIAVGYGGQWDIAQAAAQLAANGEAITPQAIESHLVTAGYPAVDLMIRTGGELRISNFLLWQAAYAELYFCDTLWPEFEGRDLHEALSWFAGRSRRFGRVPEAA
ncbi:MAG: polyprenyl diphosphate synthase [Pseudomonadota bacterium]